MLVYVDGCDAVVVPPMYTDTLYFFRMCSVTLAPRLAGLLRGEGREREGEERETLGQSCSTRC